MPCSTLLVPQEGTTGGIEPATQRELIGGDVSNSASILGILSVKHVKDIEAAAAAVAASAARASDGNDVE